MTGCIPAGVATNRPAPIARPQTPQKSSGDASRKQAPLQRPEILYSPAPGRIQPTPVPAPPVTSPPITAPAVTSPAVTSRPQPPADLLNAILGLGGGFKGIVGISIRDIDRGWAIGYNENTMMPQQSVSKFWVAIAVMDAVDHGKLSLNDPVTVRHSDLTLFHQPSRSLVGKLGYRTTVAELLRGAMTRSDNTSNDVLLWKIGGPSAVIRMLQKKGIRGVGFGPGERVLQSKTAGLVWDPKWAGGWGFLQARSKMTYAARDKALRNYLSKPYDGASANGLTQGLALLERGELLKPASTAHLLKLMYASKTGPLRLKSGLKVGWTYAHKTGTGQELGALSTGYNDVGILKSPTGQRYAVAVMIGSTRQSIPVRMRLMGDVTRALIRAVE